ncbi:hypothetical protein OSB04_027977 [Centaurea solstitialis]|uniref:Mitochondrial Rho GTPase n=1 Tax=Centaurea solstitialis TaxID=347529 RepID=A0AA38ST48_9ASTR|nr:hypothetical protein OSB04_027977 [Centaurea solstitialis]
MDGQSNQIKQIEKMKTVEKSEEMQTSIGFWWFCYNFGFIGSMEGGGGSTPAKLSIRIVVAGDHGTGKSSLISTAAAAAEAFFVNLPPVLPPTMFPEHMFPEGVPVTLIDTSSSLENRGELIDELKRADVVILTYACDQPSTLERLSTFWLPELRRLEVKVPVVVVGCRFDLRDEQQAFSLEQVLSPIMQQFWEIDTCIECSAYEGLHIPEVFDYARKAVLYPKAPLFGQEAQTLKPRCLRALKRIFMLCDHDRDGALNDAELHDFQIKCFNTPMQPQEIAGVKRVVQEKLPEGVHENGLTLTGFLFLHALFIGKGNVETTWMVLRKFGYNNDIKLDDDQLLPPIKRTPDQSVELTNEAVAFLRGVFFVFDIDGDGALNADELEDVFSTAPESPWSEAPYVDAAEKNASGGLSLDGFLAKWALMTRLDPVLSLTNLVYIGYAGDLSSAVRVTQRRCIDREEQHSDRNVFQCFVFGPKEAGKSSLLDSFVGRPFSEVYTPTTEERYTVNIVDEPGARKKTLILREIPEDAIENLLIDQDALATCDIAVFVHDSSNKSSLIKATKLLAEVARHGESTGYEVPCLVVAAKDDLNPYRNSIQDPTWIVQVWGHLCISAKVRDISYIFHIIVTAAEHPHLSIPEMNIGDQFHRLLHRFLTNFDLVGSMGGGGSTAAKLTSTTSVRIVVVGDRGTGKSSLIVAAAMEAFPKENVPPGLPPIRLPWDMFPDSVPVTIIDTPSSFENIDELADELKRADVVVLTYACDQPSTFERLSTFWLPELRRLEVNVPVVVAGCKLDLKDEHQAVSLEQVMSPIMEQFREIETCVECSAYHPSQIPDVFYYSQKAVLHPTAPLFDQEAQALKPRCVGALKRIFMLCDHDRDGALSDAELNDFQVKCFNAPLLPLEIQGVKSIVQEKLPEGVNENGVTLVGFIFLHAIFIEKGRMETIWTVLRKFGYNNDVRLGDDQLPPIIQTVDQSVELTSEAVEFLGEDGALNADELEDVFSTASESPWSEAPYVNAAEKNASGGLSLDGFLAQWALMTLLDPVLSVKNLIYIGYPGDPSSAVRVTRRRYVDCKKQHSDRNVFQCFVFGPKEVGKSSLLHSFVGRSFSEVYTPTKEEQYTVNIVDEPGGPKKTLILREISEDAIGNFLTQKDALATCDIAVFIHDSSNESSWIRASELLVQVASHGESTGHEVPCLIVAAKADLDPYPTAIQDSTRMSQDMGIEAPIPISAKLGDFNNIFWRIIRAAENPHLSIPQMEAGNTNQFHRLLHHSLTVVSASNNDYKYGICN